MLERLPLIKLEKLYTDRCEDSSMLNGLTLRAVEIVATYDAQDEVTLASVNKENVSSEIRGAAFEVGDAARKVLKAAI